MAAGTTANTITVAQTLQQLDGDFAAVAKAVGNGEFALWVGSGISRQAPNLGKVIARGLESLRKSAATAGALPGFVTALKEAIGLSNVSWNEVSAQIAQPFDTWPQAKTITDELWNRYSEFLDIRIDDQPDDDYMLWTAVDIREAFENPKPPACEHLCIGILVLEGLVTEIASANWDGFIEAAIDRLSGGTAGLLQVVVDPAHLRDGPGRARLLKFHGCVVHATQDPTLYRTFLIGAASQITTWPTSAAYKAIRTEVVSVATNSKALMIGLSLQDSNLQWVFAEARSALTWPWPCAPQAQGHVFCEDTLGNKQRAMLKVVYGAEYTPNQADIEKSALLQSWPEQVLLALVVKLLCDKLAFLAEKAVQGTGVHAHVAVITAELTKLRDQVAAAASSDRTAFANTAIAMWSRGLRLFRSGQFPVSPDTYEALSVTGLAQLSGDANTLASGLGEAAVGMALLAEGQSAGAWSLAAPAGSTVTDGALRVMGTWDGARPVNVFFVRGAAEAIALKKQGALANDNVLVVHSDDAWAQMQNDSATPPSARRPKRPPGRTGAVPVRHVSVRELVGGASSMATLVTKFRERAGL